MPLLPPVLLKPRKGAAGAGELCTGASAEFSGTWSWRERIICPA